MSSQRGSAILADAEKLGFEFVEYTGSGHIKIRHSVTGEHAVIPSTPSSWRSHANTIAQLERLSGHRLPRQKSGSFRHRPSQPRLQLRQSTSERAASEQVQSLLDEAEQLRCEFTIITRQAPSRSVAEQARPVVVQFEKVRKRLADLHRIIDPLS